MLDEIYNSENVLVQKLIYTYFNSRHNFINTTDAKELWYDIHSKYLPSSIITMNASTNTKTRSRSFSYGSNADGLVTQTTMMDTVFSNPIPMKTVTQNLYKCP